MIVAKLEQQKKIFGWVRADIGSGHSTHWVAKPHPVGGVPWATTPPLPNPRTITIMQKKRTGREARRTDLVAFALYAPLLGVLLDDRHDVGVQ